MITALILSLPGFILGIYIYFSAESGIDLTTSVLATVVFTIGFAMFILSFIYTQALSQLAYGVLYFNLHEETYNIFLRKRIDEIGAVNKAVKHIVYISLYFLVLPFQLCIAQELVKKDSSTVDVTYFKDDIKERYSSNDFNYDINDTGGINLVQSIFRKFFKWLGDIFGVDIDFIDYKTLEYIVYGLLLWELFIFLFNSYYRHQ